MHLICTKFKFNLKCIISNIVFLLQRLQIQYLDRIPGLYVNSECNTLYLTMTFNNKTIVGYKEIKLNNNLNQFTTPDDCCWGVAHVPPSKSNHSLSAIIVDDFKQLLVLAGHQSSYHIICVPHGIYLSYFIVLLINGSCIQEIFKTII